MDPKNTDQQSQPEIPSEHYAGIFDEPPAPVVSSVAPDTSQAEPKGTVTLSSPIINSVEAAIPAAIGAGAGEMLLKKGPQPYNMTPEYTGATTELTNADIAKNALQKNLGQINATHAGNIGQLELQYQDKLDTLRQLEEKLKEARFRAENLDAIDFGERKVPGASGTYNYGAVMPGDEVPHKLLLEAEDMTTGKHGKGAGDIAEKNRLLAEKQKALGLQDYRLRGKLENQLFVPPNPNITPGEQRLARKAYELAKAEHDTHAQEVKSLADKLEKLKGTSPEGKREVVKKLTDKEIEYLQAQAKLEALKPKPSFIERGVASLPYGQEAMEALGKANTAMNANPVLRHVLPIAGGGLGVVQGLQGIEDWQKGEKLKGALEAISGAGGVLSAVPHPLARGVGLGMQLPYLGYEGYEYLSDKLKR